MQMRLELIPLPVSDVDRAITFITCPDCDGTRLNETARSSKIRGINIADDCAHFAESVGGLNRDEQICVRDASDSVECVEQKRPSQGEMVTSEISGQSRLTLAVGRDTCHNDQRLPSGAP